jgi:hypothetical protein
MSEFNANEWNSVKEYIDSLTKKERHIFSNGMMYGEKVMVAFKSMNAEQIAKFFRDTGEPDIELEKMLEKKRQRENRPWWKIW